MKILFPNRRLLLGLVMLHAGSTAAEGGIEGEPWKRHAVDNGNRGADGVHLADVNGDGLHDIAAAFEEGDVVRAYLHPAGAAVKDLWPAVTVGKVKTPEYALFADVDGDGQTDIVSATESDSKAIYVHWAPSAPSAYLDDNAWETAIVPASEGREWMFLRAERLDGERLSLIAGSKDENAAIAYFELPANPREVAAWIWHPLREATWVMSIFYRDMNADGKPDILYSERRGENRGIWWLEHPADAASDNPWTPHQIGSLDQEVMFFDISGESPSQELTAATRGAGIFHLTQRRDGWDQTEIPLPRETGTGKSAVMGDIDGDGVRDIVVSCEYTAEKHGVFWLKQTAAGWEARTISGLKGTIFDLVRLIDLDQDGDLDVLICEEWENLGVVWYENPLQ